MAASKKNSKKILKTVSAGADVAAKSSSVSFPEIRLPEMTGVALSIEKP